MFLQVYSQSISNISIDKRILITGILHTIMTKMLLYIKSA